jgi:hypothetical protein
MKRNNYYARTCGEFFLTWATILIGGPLGLMFLGFVLKLIWNCFMVGWGAV